MAEPKVEFDISGIIDEKVKEQFDQFRRWFEFREDFRYPAMQTFEGILEDNTYVDHYVPGTVYGATGRTEVLGANKYWANMIAQSGAGRNYISAQVDSPNNNAVRVYGNSNAEALRYTLTVFYR